MVAESAISSGRGEASLMFGSTAITDAICKLRGVRSETGATCYASPVTGKSWVAEFMKSVGQSTFDDLTSMVENDIAEYNGLPVEARRDHMLRLDRDVTSPRHARLAVVYEGQGQVLPKLSLEYERVSNAVRISCLYSRLVMTVKPLWQSDSNRTVYQIDDYRYDEMSQISQKILLPVILYPNLDWGDALQKIRE